MSKPVVYNTAKPAYLTVQAFAERFSVSKMTILRMVHNGEITALRVGRQIRIPLSELKRYEEASRMGGES